MKRKILFLFLATIILINNYGQVPEKKIELGATINYALLGDGDFGGLYYDNSVSYSIRQFFDICTSVGFLVSSNSGTNNILISHNDVHLMGDVLFILTPAEGKRINLSFGIGYTNRYRAQTRLQYLKITNDEIITEYENLTSFDIGYMGQLSFGYKILPKVKLIVNGELHYYNKGTGLASVGFGINYRL
jgi:hypothetical protein